MGFNSAFKGLIFNTIFSFNYCSYSSIWL